MAVKLSRQPPQPPPPDPKVHLETAANIPTPYGDIVYPGGWNPAQLKASLYGGGGVVDFASKFYGGYYTEQGGKGNIPGAQPTGELPGFPGIPSTHAWKKDETTGEWIRKEHESVFDELYAMNGVDPEDSDAVEQFWSFADEDLLFAGELFDVIEWEDDSGGGYGGYGNKPTPSRQYCRGQKPSRGDYASYLGLTSWSI